MNSFSFFPLFGHGKPVRSVDASFHAVQFYEEDAALVDRIAEFVGSALGGGHAAVVVATPQHQNHLVLLLMRRGLDVSSMSEDGRLQLLDATAALHSIMINNRPDKELFFRQAGEMLSKASASVCASQGRPAIFGELSPLLWASGNVAAALQLEEWWNELSKTYTFSSLCAYPMSSFTGEEDLASLRHICALHTRVTPCESYSSLTDEASRMQEICELQQQAHTLKVETGRRKELEAALDRWQAATGIVN
jgi:hypothetical protein